MKATVLGCTLKTSPARSNSELLADEVIAGLESNGVECETVRLMGPGPGPDYADTDHGKEWSKTTAATCAHNLFHVARALKERPIPPE